MTDALYNEIEPFAADWLERLAERGHVAPGRVERRSIADLTPADVAGPGQRHFFAGIGGWSLACRLAGVPDAVSVWTGSCPCQPLSSASRGRARGADDERHLWPVWLDLIRECRPAVLFGEQVSTGLGLEWMDGVRADLESEGYAVGALDLCASLLGYPRRERLFFFAYAHGDRERARAVDAQMARLPTIGRVAVVERVDLYRVGPESDGFPTRMGQRGAYGNAIVPEVGAVFIRAALDAVGGRVGS